MICTKQIETLRARKGIGLLELMLALAIIAILIIMATRYYQSASASQKVADAQGQITNIMSAATSWRIGQADYTNITMANIAGGLSKALLGTTGAANAGKAASPWGTDVTVAKGTTAATQFIVTFAGIPGYACDALSAKYPSTSSIVNTVNGQTGTSTTGPCTFQYTEGS